MLVKALGK